MPGAPNRPPEKTEAAPPPPSVPEPPEKKALRRLVPTRVALLLDTWKGAPSPDLMGPFRKAEEAFAHGDYATVTSSLDLLSVRFAEPRWATLPEPFRFLRVSIPAPVPPHWDPDHALTPAEKEAKKARRVAGEQLALAKGCLAWANGHGVVTGDLAVHLEGAAVRLSEPAGLVPFYEQIDAFWTGLYGRLPAPKSGPSGSAPAAAAEPEEA
ncbi:MAG TPA: hypothetical protein VEG66_05390 [Thermoplasmata archaeon]|jgi:hypothetical protein|nr:hypothetical protein [Thermoplasmata archaeon]